MPGDLKQICTVMRYELLKNLKRWRLVGLLILVATISVIAGTVAGGTGSLEELAKNFLGPFSLLIVVITGIFLSGDVISSEFEGGAGYLLFSNPIKRIVLVAGKFIAAFLSALLVISIFYLSGILTMLNTFGAVPSRIVGSFALTILFICAVLGFTFLFSSFLRGTGPAMITFLILLLLMPFLQTYLLFNVGVEPWYLLTYSWGAIAGYIDPPVQRVTTTYHGTDYNYPDFTISALVMLAYFIVPLVLSMIFTKRREMA